MSSKRKIFLIITCIIVILPILFGLIYWGKLPDSVATHFGLDGEPNGWSSKFFAVIGLPLILLLIHIFCAAALELDKRKYRSDSIKNVMSLICPVVSIFCAITIYGFALGYALNIGVLTIVFGIILVLLIVIPVMKLYIPHSNKK